MRITRAVWSLALALALAVHAPAALAECLTADPDAGDLTMTESYLTLNVPAAGGGEVSLTISDEAGGSVYERNYGAREEAFQTEKIYLPLDDQKTVYGVTLTVGGETYSFNVSRVRGKLSNQPACSAGLPMDELNGQDSWRSVTLLDLAALSGGSFTVPLCASEDCEAGTVTFAVKNGTLTVSAQVNGGEVERSKVYVAVNAAELEELGSSRDFSGTVGRLNESISLFDAAYAAVWVDLWVSYDPAQCGTLSGTELDGQADLAQRLISQP